LPTLPGETPIAEETRIFLSCRPKLLLDVIRKLVEKQIDMQVVGEVATPLALLQTTGIALANAVIITPNGDTNICGHLLVAYPALKVLTLSENGKVAYLHGSGVPKSRVNEGPGQSILDAIVDSIRIACPRN
jgi:hypothetical protein